MDFIQKLERRFGQWAIPNLTLYLLLLQIAGTILLMNGQLKFNDMTLVGHFVKQGEWVRIFSFMMMPSSKPSIWLLIAFYVFYYMGSSLEREWGTFRYNLFILCGYLFTILAAFIVPTGYITNAYFLGTVFLAFATIFPNIEFLLFFIIPVKVKWLGMVSAILYVLTLVAGTPGSKASVLAAFAVYFLFFGKAFFNNFKTTQRRKKYEAKQITFSEKPMHTCTVCKRTDKTDPALTFRYCSECGECFCEEHMKEHSHI